ncbi:molybdopterin molybdenumtransferase MoeA [Chitinimonas prasina]|uniref:Molybdopterin molybdenumtransferase n=1 Tax=Chitinimonas prasina TaxID=1434937 RepID=A0ABQ5Y9Z2_9NEIS|nr:gephyrin-like molybdotransferase Glp [Chitinimonas prasina]GLR11278.1 molybdopterin molybdenumtransferase MoeA [Chitinimonas prasina]
MSLMTFDEALARLLASAQADTRQQSLPLSECDGRVLAQDVIAPLAVPGFDNSAMDGYALHIADFAQVPASLPVVQRIAAGETGQPLAANSAARIFTGAPVPLGCNAVVPQEEVNAGDAVISLQTPPSPGQHIRRLGEDIAAGSTVLQAGQRLAPQHVALAASLGIAELAVHPALRVGLLCTGDELTQPGQPLPAGGIYNSNQFAIGGLLSRLGCQVNDYGKVADSHDATLAALRHAARENDVVITCGGVSVGEEDHVKAAVSELGQLDLWRIAIKPGKPLAFGKVGQAAFIGLPGNPVSAFLTFLLLARPFLLRRMGCPSQPATALQVSAGFDWPRADKRREFLRAKLEVDSIGGLSATLYPSQGSAVMSSLAWAGGLIDLPAGHTVKKGDTVRYLPLDQLIG